MCLTFFCLQPQTIKNRKIQFVIAFNRDQQIKRQTDILGPFNNDPNIYAGRDHISGGTWLGINIKTGIMVILTNYDLQQGRRGKSRGKLVYNFLKTQSYQKLHQNQYNKWIKHSLSQILKQRQQYSAFNLMIYSIQTRTIFYICSQLNMEQPRILQKNKSYGLCNCLIDTLWPKTQYGLKKFEKIIQNLNNYKCNQQIFDQMLEIMKDKKKFYSDPEKQSSIFVQPYFNKAQQAQRMTKCTFLAIVQSSQDQNKQENFRITMKQITYDSTNLQQTLKQYKDLLINRNQINGKDQSTKKQ